MRCSRRCFATLALAAAANAQTLAHPGWRGNGIAAEAWWKRTAIVRLGPETTFAQAAAAMDAMSAAGVDTMLLPDLQPAPGGTLPFAERFGTEDDLDALLREAAARRMHVLLTAPLLRLAGSSGEVRFWMTRGIAGFDVGAVRPADADTLYLLRTAMDGYPGTRLLLAEMDRGEARGLRGGPVLQVMKAPAAAPAGPYVVDLGDGPLPANVPAGAIPVIDEAVIEDEAGRESVRRMLAARSTSRVRHGR